MPNLRREPAGFPRALGHPDNSTTSATCSKLFTRAHRAHIPAMIIQLDPAEHATVLAALRYYQSQGLADDVAKRSFLLHNIATGEGTLVPLDGNQIDQLCEAITFADEAPPPVNSVLARLETFLTEIEHDASQPAAAELLSDLRAIIAHPPRLVITTDGGLVQSIVSDLPLQPTVIDYDVEGADPDTLTAVDQADGSTSPASVSSRGCEVNPAAINRMLT